MGGSISVDSKAGEGTTFRFSILADYEKGDTQPTFTPGLSPLPLAPPAIRPA